MIVSVSVGQRLTLHVEKPVAGGRMLARHDGAIALVAAAIPGETVEAEVEKIQRGTIWATTRRVVERSPDRVEADGDCACGGSVYAHVRYERQLDLKRDVIRDGFGRLGHITLVADIPVTPSPIDGYRMRTRLHYRGGRLGFYREGSHDLCDPGPTRQLLPATLETLSTLGEALRELPSRAIVDVDISENCPATERACHLELTPDTDPSRLAALTQIDGLTGVSCGVEHHTRTMTLWGSPVVTDDLKLPATGQSYSPIALSRHARAFFQGNRYLLSDLVAHVVDCVPAGPVVDLYAGVGLFSIALGARGEDVTAIEGDAVAAEDLKRNAAGFTGVKPRHQPVETFLSSGRGGGRPQTILVDPPRTGLSREALQGVMRLQSPRLVYVSCDVATLARDSRALVEARYRLSSIRAFDLFPNTAHVESVIVFDKP